MLSQDNITTVHNLATFDVHILIVYSKTFGVRKFSQFSRFFSQSLKVFPLNHLLCTVHDGHGLMHRESFTVNSVFSAQPQKFSHLKVLPYTVCMYIMHLLCSFLNSKVAIFSPKESSPADIVDDSN